MMQHALIFAVFICCVSVHASDVDWLIVEGHTGSHSKAMGIYAHDGHEAFGFGRYVQVDSAGNHGSPQDSYYLYRGGDPGRWIITMGEDGQNQKQCVNTYF
jgi:hypothetical protein